MATRAYNQFFGWIKEDDFLTIWPNFIEWYNITWLSDWIWATLWPKMNKQLLTNFAPRTIFGRESSSLALDWIAVWTDWWEIYKLDWADNAPIYTLTNNWNILNWAFLRKGSNFMYFASREPWINKASWRLMQVTFTDFQNESFASVNESFLNFNLTWTPPMLIDWEFLYVWWLNTIHRIDWSWVITSFWIFNRYVTGITKQWTQLKVYTDSWDVAYWDWVSSSVTSVQWLEFRSARVTSYLWVDHIITDDWDYHLWSWYSFSDPVIRKRKSLKLNDNSQYINKLDFTPDTNNDVWQIITAWRWYIFMLSSDTKPWIYQAWKIVNWLPKGYHKIIVRDNENVEFDELFTQTYIWKWQSKLFIGYQSWTTKFWVDYIDLNSKESAKFWYIVSDVFTWWTSFEKEIEVLRFAQSYNSWANDYVKLYKRINNWVWEEISLTKPVDERITTENLTTVTDEWVEIQFKIELYNDSQDDTPPYFNELSHDYDITKF